VVLWQGKGQCIDGQTGAYVHARCCQEIQACRRDIASATEATIARISTYQHRCGVDVADKAFDREKLCMAECRAAIAELGQPVDAQTIMVRCRKIDNSRGVQTLETVVPLLLGVEAAFRECDCPVDPLLQATEERMSLFHEKCKLPVADSLLTVSLDEVEPLLCSAECQAAEELEVALPDGLAEAAEAGCGDAAHVGRLQRLLPVVRDLDGKWRECKATEKAAVVKPSEQQTCADPSMRHHECGFFGIDQQGCEARGCCWDPSRDGTHWCYDTSAASRCTTMCPKFKFSREGRSDCRGFNSTHPDDKVRGAACEAAGCCWQPLEHHSDDAWCFHQPCLL